MLIEETLRRFCDSRYRWIIVITVTLLIGCGLLLPLVDVYSAQQAELEQLALELDQAQQTARDIDQFEEQVAEKLSKLEESESRMVSQESLAELRNQIVEMSRETGCQLRRINVGAVQERVWNESDNPLLVTVEKTKDTKPTSFLLQRWPVTMTLSGSVPNLRNLLTQMHRQDMLMHTKSLELTPTSRGRKESTLDMELWYFALQRKG